MTFIYEETIYVGKPGNHMSSLEKRNRGSQTNKLIEKFLVTPESLAPIAINNNIVTSSVSRFQGEITPGVAVMSANTRAFFFMINLKLWLSDIP
jgi:hypothetical protein